jgi:hypothetical protein
MTDIPELEGGRHGCPLCPSHFDSVGAKKRHIRTDHTDPKDAA